MGPTRPIARAPGAMAKLAAGERRHAERQERDPLRRAGGPAARRVARPCVASVLRGAARPCRSTLATRTADGPGVAHLLRRCGIRSSPRACGCKGGLPALGPRSAVGICRPLESVDLIATGVRMSRAKIPERGFHSWRFVPYVPERLNQQTPYPRDTLPVDALPVGGSLPVWGGTSVREHRRLRARVRRRG
jgi:hypothetical protein